MTVAETMRPVLPGYQVSGKSLLRLCAILAAVLVIVAAVCTSVGQLGWQWPWNNAFRLSRVSCAATVGAALAVAGAVLQSLLRNGLADPYVLGVSGGAGVGVLGAMVVLGQAAWAGWTAAAAIGAFLAMTIVYLIAQRRGRLDAYSLLLSGVIVNAFSAAVMATLYLFAPAARTEAVYQLVARLYPRCGRAGPSHALRGGDPGRLASPGTPRRGPQRPKPGR